MPDIYAGDRFTSAAGDRPDDKKGLRALHDGLRQRVTGRKVREVFPAGEEADEWPAKVCEGVTDGPLKHGVACFERIQDRKLSDWTGDFEGHLTVDAGEAAEARGQFDADPGCR